MIDTLKDGAAPVQSTVTVASVHLQDISFKEDKLWQPQYPTLFDYDAVPSGLNIVPSFQVRDHTIQKVEITLELAQPFEIQSDLSTFWRMIGEGNPNSVTSSSVTSTSCVLHVDLATLGAKVAVLQVLCRQKDQTEFSGKEQIEGGLFLCIVNDPGQPVFIQSLAVPDPHTGKILVLGLDDHERVIYNIFLRPVYADLSMLSASLAPEPAFRVQQAHSFEVQISLKPQGLIFISRVNHPDEIAIVMNEPGIEPPELHVAFPRTAEDQPIPEGCIIRWISPAVPQPRGYFVTSFSMELREVTTEAQEFLTGKGWDGNFDRKLLELISGLSEGPEFHRNFPYVGTADPTVIDTPKCTTINGQTVCSE